MQFGIGHCGQGVGGMHFVALGSRSLFPLPLGLTQEPPHVC